jgi:hypothetical protein
VRKSWSSQYSNATTGNQPILCIGTVFVRGTFGHVRHGSTIISPDLAFLTYNLENQCNRYSCAKESISNVASVLLCTVPHRYSTFMICNFSFPGIKVGFGAGSGILEGTGRILIRIRLIIWIHNTAQAHCTAVLRIRDVYPGSRILIFTHSGSRISDPKTATKERGENNLLSNLSCSHKFHKIEKVFYF